MNEQNVFFDNKQLKLVWYRLLDRLCDPLTTSVTRGAQRSSFTVGLDSTVDIRVGDAAGRLQVVDGELRGDASAERLRAATAADVDLVTAAVQDTGLATQLNVVAPAPDPRSVEPASCGTLFVGFGRCAWLDDTTCACNAAYDNAESLCKSFSGTSCCWTASTCDCRQFWPWFTDCWLNGKATT
jgi:hypothetical protein